MICVNIRCRFLGLPQAHRAEAKQMPMCRSADDSLKCDMVISRCHTITMAVTMQHHDDATSGVQQSNGDADPFSCDHKANVGAIAVMMKCECGVV